MSDEIEKLKECKEWMKKHFYCEEMLHVEKREHKATKRALWMARAARAKVEYQHWILIQRCEYTNHHFFINKSRYKHTSKVDRLRYPWEWRDIWFKVEKRCIKKAEEYK